MTSNYRLVTAFVASVLSSAGCSSVRPAVEPAPTVEPIDRTAADGAGQTLSVFGFTFGTSRAALIDERPSLTFTSDPSTDRGVRTETALEIEGVPTSVGLYYYDDRLYMITFAVVGAAATVEAYRSLVARLEADVGDGASTRCESEDGVPFARYLTEGRGYLITDWADDRVTGRISASRFGGAPGSLGVRGALSFRRFAPICDVEDLVCSAPPASQKKETARGCTVDLSTAPPASLMGLRFGSSRTEAEAALGLPLDEGGVYPTAPMTIDGVQGQLHLGFYDGCLAVIMMTVHGDGATIDAYHALQTWASDASRLGPGDAMRCVSEEGVPDPEHIASGRGSLNDQWRGDGPVEASLRLEALYGRREPSEIVFQASYLPLRDHAPQIDFEE